MHNDAATGDCPHRYTGGRVAQRDAECSSRESRNRLLKTVKCMKSSRFEVYP